MATQYSEDQLKEIELGKQQGLDTSVYENPAFLAMQMQEIRLGLSKGLNVSIYADPEFDWLQMEELRSALEIGLDAKKFADKSIPHDIMREERKALEQGVDLSDYKGGRRGRSASVMRQLRKGRREGVELMPFIKEGYDSEQLEQIRICLEKEIDIEPYLSLDYRGSAIDEIRQGLEDQIDVSAYTDVEYNWRQMREIRLGLVSRVDITKYSHKFYSSQQMREIRLGLEAGLNVDDYRLMRFSATDMKQKRLELIEIIESAQRAGEAALAQLDSLIKQADYIEEGIDPITLIVSPDKMEAYVMIREDCEEVTEQEILKVVWEGNIRKGIDRAAMREAENGFRGEDGKIVVARGEMPVNGVDGWYEYFFRTNLDGKPKILENGSVDYNNIEWFDTIKMGDRAALYHPATKGKDGFNVLGEVLHARNGKEQPVLKGKGFILSEDKLEYTSAVDGLVVLKNDSFLEISDVLEVDEVNNTTGFVVFKGSVHVRGDVGAGGVINCGGDVIIDGFVEGGNITAEGDVLLRRGMNGGGRGVIRAGRNVTGKFFENADVYAGDTITIDYSTNSELFAENTLEVVKRKGAIIGGKVTALKGMTLFNVGNYMGTKTIITSGVPKKAEQEGKEIREKIYNAKQQLKILRNAEADFHNKYPLKMLTTMEVFKKIEDAIYTKELDIENGNKELEAFEERMKDFNRAKIKVKGDLYEGVDVVISGKHWISSGMSDVTMKLVNDEHGQHIIAYNDIDA